MYGEMLVGMTGAMMEDAAATAKNTEETVKEIASLKAELEQTRNELASYKAEQAEQREADSRQADLNTKKAFRHDYFVATVSIFITLVVEHLPEIYDLLCRLVEFVGVLFH